MEGNGRRASVVREEDKTAAERDSAFLLRYVTMCVKPPAQPLHHRRVTKRHVNSLLNHILLNSCQTKIDIHGQELYCLNTYCRKLKSVLALYSQLNSS